MGCDIVLQGGGKSSGTCDVTLLWKNVHLPKRCLSYLLVSDKMSTDSDTAGRWLLWLKLFFYCQLLYVNCKIMFEMIMMINDRIHAYILFIGRWITFGWLGNYSATFGKTHTVEGVLWHVTFFIGGLAMCDSLWQKGKKVKYLTYFWMAPERCTGDMISGERLRCQI